MTPQLRRYRGRHRPAALAEAAPTATVRSAPVDEDASGPPHADSDSDSVSVSGSDSDSARMARGGGINLVGAVFQQLCLFAIVTLLAHQLGAADVGRYAMCFAMLAILNLLALAGFRGGLTRFVAMHLVDGDSALVRGTVRFGLTLTVVGASVIGVALALLAGPVSRVFDDPALETGIRLVTLGLPAQAFTDAALAATQGWRTQRDYTVIGRVFHPGVRLVLTVGAVAAGWGFTGAMIALVVGEWATAVLAARAVLRRVRTVPAARPRYEIKELLSFSMVSWGSALAATGLIWADTLILGGLTSAEQVGIYNVATRLVTLAVFVMPPINAMFSPHMAHLHHRGDLEGAARAYGNAARWTLITSMPAFVLLIVMPEKLLRFFGAEFTQAVWVTILLACGQLVSAAAGPCGVVLNMSGRVWLSLVDNLGVLVGNVVLNFVLVPRYGIVGAAVAWSASIIVANAAKIAQARWIVGVRPLGADWHKTIGAALPAALAVWAVRTWVPDWRWAIVLGGVVSVVIYATGIRLLGMNGEDRQLIRLARQRAPRLARS